jgi:uncharacterized protein
MTSRPPLPPFTRETAIQKIRAAEDAWNSRDPERCSKAYTTDSRWRNRSRFLAGTEEIIAFLTEKWEREHDYRLIKELWAFTDERIAVRFAYEWRSGTDQWFRAYGNENWLFDGEGLMAERQASINDVAIEESERKFRWDSSGPRPADHPGLTVLGL